MIDPCLNIYAQMSTAVWLLRGFVQKACDCIRIYCRKCISNTVLLWKIWFLIIILLYNNNLECSTTENTEYLVVNNINAVVGQLFSNNRINENK